MPQIFSRKGTKDTLKEQLLCDLCAFAREKKICVSHNHLRHLRAKNTP